MRSSIADFQVIRALPETGAGQLRYLCRPPERLDEVGSTVMVTELAVDASGWRDLAGQLTDLAATGSDRLLDLIEVGPDLGADGAGVYLATETAPGGSTADPIRPLDPGARVRAVAEAALGAHAMHESGLAHGAIDPEAILLTERGAVLAPPALGGPPGLVTRVRGWANVAVLDPAILRGEEPSRASDVWALAATLHGLLAGEPLYPGIDRDPTVTAVQRVLFTRPQIDASLPGPLRDALAACLAEDPAERVETAAELADLLAVRG